MNPAQFAYSRPERLEDALAELSQSAGNGKILAGGHSLLPIMKLRLAEPESLIDISRIPALKGIERVGDRLHIGAMTTHSQVASDSTLRDLVPLLAETALQVGDRQVRNRGTIGGALAHADAASDYPAAILALDAEIVVQSARGERSIPASEFFVDFLTTALSPEEILTRIRVHIPVRGHGWSYQKLANQASGYAIVGVAAIVELRDGGAADVRVGVTGTAAVPWRARNVESALAGTILNDSLIREAVEAVTDGVEPLDDLHGSAEYRQRVTRGLAARAISTAFDRARARG
jgi:carbon-monoxide dehydrogenase medium subunit